MSQKKELKVQCSGALFSSLMFELLKYRKPQEGFFLGEIQTITSTSISDSQINNETSKIIINITSFVPCSSTVKFYSGCGNVNENLIKSCVGNDLQKVVGWYRSRRSCQENFFREIRVHKQLKNILPHTEDNLIMALISDIEPGDKGIMDFTSKFLVVKDSCDCEGVSLNIINMTDSSASHYIRDAPSSALYNSGTLETIFKDYILEPGVSEAIQLHSGLLDKLRDLLPKYSKVQETHYKMTQELVRLTALCHASGIQSDYIPREEGDNARLDQGSTSPVLQKRSRTKVSSNESKTAKTSASAESPNSSQQSQKEEKEGENSVYTETPKAKTKKGGKKTGQKGAKIGSASRNNSPKPKVTKGKERHSSSPGINGLPSPNVEETKTKLGPKSKVLKAKDSNLEERTKVGSTPEERSMARKSKSPSAKTKTPLKTPVKKAIENNQRDGNVSPEY